MKTDGNGKVPCPENIAIHLEMFGVPLLSGCTTLKHVLFILI